MPIAKKFGYERCQLHSYWLNAHLRVVFERHLKYVHIDLGPTDHTKKVASYHIHNFWVALDDVQHNPLAFRSVPLEIDTFLEQGILHIPMI